MSDFPGARWWKFDFHTHTKTSTDFMNGRPQADREAFSNRDWLKACLDAEVDCVVVTDHNGGGSIDGLRAEFQRMQDSGETGGRQLIIFPGVEISSGGGLHILGILDPSQGDQEIGSLVGACGYRGAPGASEECSTKTPIEIVTEIDARRGVAIMAHVDGPKGLFGLASPQDGEPLIRHNPMMAVEQLAFDALPPEWISQKKPKFTRVGGSDAHFKNSHDVPGRQFTWIKMGTPSIDGLRMALLDGDGVSVWHSGDPNAPLNPNKTPDCFLESLEVHGAKLMGYKAPEVIPFNPWMNAVIGGRGTGKSSIVHFLRRLLDQDDDLGISAKENENLLRKIFDEFMREPKKREDKGVLRPGSKLGLILRHEGHRFRITWKLDGSRQVDAEDGAGDWKPSESQEVRKRFKAQIYSQGQVAELAERGASLLEHLDKKAGTETVKRVFMEAQEAVKTILGRKRSMEKKASERETLRAQFEDIKLKLAQFETHHHAEILKEFQKRQRQGTEIQKQREEATRHAETLDSVIEQLLQSDLPEGLFDPTQPEDKEVIVFQATLRGAVDDAKTMVAIAKQKLETAASVFQDSIQGGEWGKAREAIKTKYTELTTGLKSQGIQDPSDYSRLLLERQRIEEELKDFDSLEEQLRILEKDLQSAKDRLTMARWSITEHRSAFLNETLRGNLFIQIEVEPFGRSEEQLESALRGLLGMQGDAHAAQIFQEIDGNQSGEVAEILKDLPSDQKQAGLVVERRSLAFKEKVVSSATGQSKPLGGRLDGEIRKQAQLRSEFLDDVLVWFPEDTLKVKYSPEGNGQHWKAIEQASKGQKSAALLAFLLSHGGETLILDQPEDDLDNHLIFSLVVRQLQRLKSQRQVIVVTHNANIVVNGDSEFVHVMDYVQGQCKAKQSGCLQEKVIRDEICEVMEGGKDAFKLRYRRINPESS